MSLLTVSSFPPSLLAELEGAVPVGVDRPVVRLVGALDLRALELAVELGLEVALELLLEGQFALVDHSVQGEVVRVGLLRADDAALHHLEEELQGHLLAALGQVALEHVVAHGQRDALRGGVLLSLGGCRLLGLLLGGLGRHGHLDGAAVTAFLYDCELLGVLGDVLEEALLEIVELLGERGGLLFCK
jgi:hypothetical protein